MATTKFSWQDYAILTPTAPAYNKKGEPVQWKVQINEAGTFRCSCPAYIFCKGSKQCKHTRRCEQDRLEQGQSLATPLTTPVARPVAAPNVIEATRIFDAMCARALPFVGHRGVAVTLGREATSAMIDVLAQKLAAYVPPTRVSAVQTVQTQIGVRYITFED